MNFYTLKNYLKTNYIQIVLLLQSILILVLLAVVFFPSEDKLKKDYYTSEVATLVSPHSLREEILHGTNPYVLVDTRDNISYERGHIVGAINIIPDANMVSKFKNLQKENKGKEILIYCYTQVCMRGRKVGKELAENGIYVRELGIGFNEWKNFWRNWNYENEWNEINIFDYIRIGQEPGVFRNIKPLNTSSCGTGEFGC